MFFLCVDFSFFVSKARFIKPIANFEKHFTSTTNQLSRIIKLARNFVNAEAISINVVGNSINEVANFEVAIAKSINHVAVIFNNAADNFSCGCHENATQKEEFELSFL